MKALIAAGGRATRLRPITWTTNKHLIPLANRPMLWHVIDKIVAAGIKDIIVNVNQGELEMMQKALGDGAYWGAQITYLEQKGGALGVAHVVANAEEHLRGHKFLFFLGDNIILGSINRFVERFQNENLDCMLAFSKVKDPHRFGVPEFAGNGDLLRIIEKPEVPPSDYAVTGIYLYNEEYFDAFRTLTPSARGEFEISDINTWYIENRKTGYEEITGWWKDTGTPEALLEGNALVMDDLPRDTFRIKSDVPDGARLQGMVQVGENTRISSDCLIRGPVIIGDNCAITDTYIGPYTAIGNNVKITNTEVEHSIVFDGAQIDTTRRIVNSLIGLNATLRDVKQSHPRTGHQLIVGDNSFVEL
ncbi:glucose-1-phosphate thymidylyltransferase [Patescibacteria group bacterium]|nr:glucose-1-phosphate thymidylyltransferase [Patescibacteria group bacterium]MBU1705441.1 glucose-1-phosphate thymidylyltransferase [Patescibacteria group bacterium]